MLDGVLALWCAGWASAAAIGLRRYATGASGGGARAVRVPARIVRVERPSSGARRSAGVPVVLAFRDPATGQELTVPTTGAHSGTLDAAWAGREIEVRFPPGQPYRFRMLTRPGQGRWQGLRLPAVAAFFVLAALLVRLSFVAGYGLGLLGLGALWTAALGTALRASLREYGRRRALLASPGTADGEIVAILEDERRDDDGHVHVSYTPVVTFTPPGAPTVTGVPAPGSATSRHHHRDALGLRIPVHYATVDPSVFHLDGASDRATMTCGLIALFPFALAGVALMVVGAVALAG
ncbi:DUF3592 domain-containing protein [Actinacidiphila alni]|uniref:DUF3592 domain-containing protein n=1 Tax=Actinacidiphila alni TaxID=380248 RepID=UPI0033D38E34